jgi:hypothetical protein
VCSVMLQAMAVAEGSELPDGADAVVIPQHVLKAFVASGDNVDRGVGKFVTVSDIPVSWLCPVAWSLD